MKGGADRLVLALLIVTVAVVATFVFRSASGGNPEFHVVELGVGALVAGSGAVLAVLVTGFVVLSVVRAGTREFTRHRPSTFLVRIRNLTFDGERVPLPFYRFLTVEGGELQLWSRTDQDAPDYILRRTEFGELERHGRDKVLARGQGSLSAVTFEVVPAAPWALRSIRGPELDVLVSKINAKLARSAL